MDIDEDNATAKQCYKAIQPVHGNLHIALNFSNSNTVLWNKYQVFIYENLKFESAVKIFIPEYQIHRLIITDNYLYCLDTNGFAHLTPLKFKNPAQKLIKCVYQPKDQGIKACVSFSQDLSLSLKFDEKYFICVNKINSDFHVSKTVALNSEHWGLTENTKEECLITHKIIDQAHAELFQKLFSSDKFSSTSHLIVMSFDRLTVYGCIFDLKMAEDHLKLVKLYSCPSEVCSIDVIGTDMLIALSMGSVIRLKLDTLYHNTEPMKTLVTHMNSAIHKFIVLDINTFVYTDGFKMWKAENVFSEQITFSQFFVNNIHDFTQCGDTLICTTLNKLIYTVLFREDKFWFKRKDDEYSSAENLLNNSDCMNQIFKEVERGKELASNLKIEAAYLTAMSLSRRPDIMDKVVLSEINIYDTFEEVMKRNDEDLTLTEDISAYFESDTYLLLVIVKINAKIQAGLYEVITNIMSNSQTELHVTLSNEHKTLKTTSLKISKMTCLIPIQLGNSSEINVNIRLVPIIPGTYDRKQTIWTELYKKNIKLTARYFIKGNPKRSYISLKRPREELHKSILTLTTGQFGQQFTFTDVNSEAEYHSMYVRLPRKTIADNFANYLSYTKSVFMIKALSSDDFLTSQSKICFKVGKDTVEISLENDGFSNPQLKITSKNIKITTHIRSFFSDIVYGENDCKSGEEFISNGFYTTVENLQTGVKDCISTGNFKRFKPLMEQFDKDIISVLPI